MRSGVMFGQVMEVLQVEKRKNGTNTAEELIDKICLDQRVIVQK